MTVAALRPSRLPDLELRTPTSVDELTRLVADGFRAYAGGSDILLEAAQRGEPRRLASTARVTELAKLGVGTVEISIGAAVVLARLVGDANVRALAPAVTDGAHRIGSVQLRNAATLVGNLCTSSPAGDIIPGLFIHDALVDTVDTSGTRRSIGVGDFTLGPGATALAADEVVTAVRLTHLAAGEGSVYRRFTERNATDLAFAGVAARIALEPDGETIRSAALALGAVGPTVVDASSTADPLTGHHPTADRVRAVADAAAEICSPISDHRCSADYRRQLVRVLTIEVIDLAVARAGGAPVSGGGRP